MNYIDIYTLGYPSFSYSMDINKKVEISVNSNKCLTLFIDGKYCDKQSFIIYLDNQRLKLIWKLNFKSFFFNGKRIEINKDFYFCWRKTNDK